MKRKTGGTAEGIPSSTVPYTPYKHTCSETIRNSVWLSQQWIFSNIERNE